MGKTSNNRHAIDVLKDNVLSDFQRPNLFEVVLETDGGNEALLNLTSDMIISVAYPSIMLGTVIINRMGRKLVMPGSVDSPNDVTLALYSDVEGRVRLFFDAWQRNYYGEKDTGGSVSQTSTYANALYYAGKGRATIYGLDGNHKRRHRTTVYRVYPRVVGEMQFSHNTENSLGIFSVTLAFSYAEYASGESSIPQN